MQSSTNHCLDYNKFAYEAAVAKQKQTAIMVDFRKPFRVPCTHTQSIQRDLILAADQRMCGIALHAAKKGSALRTHP
jgi:hypothetical protein